MNESILTWNMTNWITVVLMGAAGFAALGAAAQLMKKYRASGNTNA